MATRTSTAVKIVDALTDGSVAVLEAARSANERNYRISKAVFEEIERGQQETFELGRQFAREPANLSGFSSAAFGKANEAQGRVVELVRQWFSEVQEAGQEARQTLERVTAANRKAAQAAFEGARGLFQQSAENLQDAVRPGTDGGRAPRARIASEATN